MSPQDSQRVALEDLLREGRIDEAVGRVETLVAKLDNAPAVTPREAVERVVARFARLRKIARH